MTTPTTTPDGSTEKAPATTPDRTTGMPSMLDWLQNEFLGLARPSQREREMRFEEYVDGNEVVLRVEVPGIDPERDLDVSVADGFLTLRAERRRTRQDARHSEFSYGGLVRTFALPPGANEDAATATYRDGVLEVRVPVDQTQPGGRKIPVERGDST